MKKKPEQLEQLNARFRMEELQERLEYKVTKPGREDWYDHDVTVTTSDPYTGTTTTTTQHNDW